LGVFFDRIVATAAVDFGQQSFIEWHLKEKFHEETANAPYQTDLRLMFRTRQRSGSLFMAQNLQKSKHIILEVGLELFTNLHRYSLLGHTSCTLCLTAYTGWPS